jgi:hypothetical protein
MSRQSPLTDARRAELDAAALDLLILHGIEQPPVPIEDMLRRPAADLWKPDLVDLSLQSFDSGERYAARPTIARLVARYAGASAWARRRGLTGKTGFTRDEIRYFGRALLMPQAWIAALPLAERNPATVRVRFQVPTSDAAQRLAEINPNVAPSTSFPPPTQGAT